MPVSAPPRSERRKSVTIASGAAGSASSTKTMRTRTRRTQSRDSGTSSRSRRLSAVSPYRVDSKYIILYQ
jgi:hypothetical protein